MKRLVPPGTRTTQRPGPTDRDSSKKLAPFGLRGGLPFPLTDTGSTRQGPHTACSIKKRAPASLEPVCFLWSGWRDLNARPQRPERCALAKLSHIPLQERILHRRPAVCKLFFQKNFSPLMSGGIRSCPAESRTWRYMFCAYRAIRL